MPQLPHPLPADVVEAIERGEKITAIKLLRTATGLGLKEAKDAVEAHGRVDHAGVRPPPVAGAALPPSVVEALERGNKLEAIKRLRAETGLGLKEARDAVEGRPPSPVSGDRPGSGALPWLAVAVILAIVAFFFL